MTFTYFALIVCVAGLFGSGTTALRFQILLCLFGSASAVALPALGGAVITPAVLFLPFLIVRALLERRPAGYLHRVPTAGVLIVLLATWGVLGAFFLPRVFAGAIEIITVDRRSIAGGAALYPLRPVSGNITQTGYAVCAAAAFLAVRALLERPGRMERFRDGVLLLGALNCAAAFLELGQYHLGLPKLLDYVRTGYAAFETYEAQATGMLRVQGTFPETSTFSAFTLPLFAFALSLWIDRVRPLYTGTVAALSLLLLLISTSATAYVGLTIYLTILAFIWLWRSYIQRAFPLGALHAAFVVLLACGVVLYEAELAHRVVDFFEASVFRKLERNSGIERMAWNRQAFMNFVDTFGLGVGLGSARASSFVVVLLSNLGLIGTVLFAGFLTKVLKGERRGLRSRSPVREAARQAVMASFAATSVSWGVFDLGIAFYAFAAAASFVGESDHARSGI